MNAAANKTLEDNSDLIAQSLLKNTLGGNASCAKLLFSLAEGQMDTQSKNDKPNYRSTAKALASEPEWNADENEAGKTDA